MTTKASFDKFKDQEFKAPLPHEMETWSSGEYETEENEEEDDEDEEEETDDEEEDETDDDSGGSEDEDESLITERGARSSGPQHLRARTWFFANAKTSFFIGSLLVGLACTVVGCACLGALDGYYGDVLHGVSLVRDYDAWVKLETQLQGLEVVAPAYALTNDGVLGASLQSHLSTTIQMADQLVQAENTNISLGFQIKEEEANAVSDMNGRLAATAASHTKMQDDRSTREAILALYPSSPYLGYSSHNLALVPADSSYQYIHALKELGASQASLLHSLQRLYHHFQSSLSNDQEYTPLLLGLYSNVSRIAFIAAEDLFAVESLYARTPSALAAVSLGGSEGRPGTNDEVLVNDTLSSVFHLKSEFENVSQIVSTVHGAMNLSNTLNAAQVELLSVLSNQSVQGMVKQVEALQRAQIAARAMFHEQQEIFTASKSTTTIRFTDVGESITSTLGDYSGVRTYQKDMDVQTQPIRHEKQLEARAKAEELLHHNIAGMDGVTIVQISAGVVLSPMLAYLAFAVVGVNAEVRKSWLPYKFFIMSSVAVVVLLTGIMGGAAGKTIAIISHPQDLVSTIQEVEKRQREIVSINEAARKFAAFLRQPEDEVPKPIQSTAAATAYTRTVLLLLGSTGREKIVDQFKTSSRIAQAFNKSHATATQDPEKSLYAHWDPSTQSSASSPLGADCKALISSVAFLMLASPYTMVSSSDLAAMDSMENSFFSLVGLADACTALCSKNLTSAGWSTEMVETLWTGGASAPSLCLSITEPTHNVLHYIPAVDRRSGNHVSTEITAHLAHLQDVTLKAAQFVEAQARPLEAQRARDYRLVAWLTVCSVVLAQFAAWLIARSLFNDQAYF